VIVIYIYIFRECNIYYVAGMLAVDASENRMPAIHLALVHCVVILKAVS
jgi:hypothetical protein